MEVTKITSHLVKGLIIGLILVVISVGVQFSGIKSNSWPVQLLSTCILIAGIIWSVWYYGKQKDNFVTFGNLFGHGFKTTAIIAIIVIVFTIIFFVAFPEYKDKGMEESRKQMEEAGKMTDDQIDQAMDIAKRFFLVFVIGSILVIYAIIGAISSLIGAAITKKKPVTPFDGQ